MVSQPRGLTTRFRRQPRETWTHFVERIASAFGLVLLLVLTTYVVASLTVYEGGGAIAITALASTSGAVAIASSGAKLGLVHSAFGIAIAVVGLAAVAAVAGVPSLLAAAGVAQALLLGAAVVAVLRTVLGETEVGFRTILGAVSVYITFGLLFTFLYAAIDRLQPGPFFNEPHVHTGDYVFFSFTTLTTAGYGNLVPVAEPGKMFAGLEMLLGQVFLVTLVAGLVSLWRPGSRLSRGLHEPES